MAVYCNQRILRPSSPVTYQSPTQFDDVKLLLARPKLVMHYCFLLEWLIRSKKETADTPTLHTSLGTTPHIRNME